MILALELVPIEIRQVFAVGASASSSGSLLTKTSNQMLGASMLLATPPMRIPPTKGVGWWLCGDRMCC